MGILKTRKRNKQSREWQVEKVLLTCHSLFICALLTKCTYVVCDKRRYAKKKAEWERILHFNRAETNP